MRPGEDVPDLVSTAWLSAHARDPHVRIVDLRWYMDGRRGVDAYRGGHIPGAVFVDLENDLSTAHTTRGPGRHPLPGSAAFSDLLSRIGIGSQTHVIAYDDDGGSRAARLWWMLRYFGHGQGSVLDGGLQQWVTEGRPTEANNVRVSRAEPMELVALPRFTVDKTRVFEVMQRSTTLLLDARAPERYAGVSEPVDARAGHIPGAKNAPYVQNLRSPTGPFRSPVELREKFQRLGVAEGKQIIVYCGSGVTACHAILALHLADFRDAQLYEGSWSDWASDPSLPIKTGNEP